MPVSDHPASLASLPEARLLSILRYCDSKSLARCSQLNRQFKILTNSDILWRYVNISGHCSRAVKFIDQVLLKHTSSIKAISFESISFMPDPRSNVHAGTFFASIEALLSQVGSNLLEFRVDDAVATPFPEGQMNFRLPVPSQLTTGTKHQATLFGNFHSLIQIIKKHCPNVKAVSLSGDRDSMYIGDENMKLLTEACPTVESFVDEEACGLSPQAILTMATGWSNLTSLELDTESMDIVDFKSSISLFGDRLTRLSITHFAEALSKASFSSFVSTLKNLTHLEILAIDHSETQHLDGFDSDQLKTILDACPRLKGFEYFSSIKSYFEFHDDEEEDDEEEEDGDNESSSEHDVDPDTLVDTWRSVRAAKSVMTRRTSIGSISMATTRFGKGRRPGGGLKLASLSIFSKEEEDGYYDGGDVSSLAPALPSPNEFGNLRVEVYGMWMSGDKLSIRERALRIVGFESGSDFFIGKQDLFFAILDSLYSACNERNVKVTFAWSI
ncbi:hypothetical protein BDR26DRAFT_587088 [Obelidium mucronatum]|nr:hypothetical protein BDR26DRAFT_587088 [Obelidium mucronatum]